VFFVFIYVYLCRYWGIDKCVARRELREAAEAAHIVDSGLGRDVSAAVVEEDIVVQGWLLFVI
jgi:hypothetical protein